MEPTDYFTIEHLSDNFYELKHYGGDGSLKTTFPQGSIKSNKDILLYMVQGFYATAICQLAGPWNRLPRSAPFSDLQVDHFPSWLNDVYQATPPPAPTPAPTKVLILGAGGKSGLLTLKKMLGMPGNFDVFAAVRTEQSGKKVTEETGAKTMVCNLVEPGSAAKAMTGVDILVVLSSATPKPSYFKLLGQVCKKLCCFCCLTPKMGKAFGYQPGAYPKDVDWEGGKAAIDAAMKSGVKHVIYVGSMGGTKPDHFLNQMGGGDILLWKRKAELYLRQSGLNYTIIHPGGLLPHFGNKHVPGGERELLVNVNDAMLENPVETRCIPREDLAEVVVQTALEPKAYNGIAFDLSSKDPAKIKGTTPWDKNLKTLLTSAGITAKSYDYSSPKHPILDVN